MEVDNNKNLNKITDNISTLIHEYLFKKEYYKTLDAYQEELSEKLKSGTYYNNPKNKNKNSNLALLKNFDLGNKTEFMNQWKRMIPNHMKVIEPSLNKIDFYIEIYFAIYPLLKSNTINLKVQSEMKENMEYFKKYLENKEIELSKTTEFLAFYALPYIPNPKGHPSYEKLFKPEWVNDLKDQIQNFIKYFLPSFNSNNPGLYDLFNNNKIISDNILSNINENKNNEKIEILQKENESLIEEIKKLKNKQDRNKTAFIDSQKTWTNLSLNIIDYSFKLIDTYKKSSNNTYNSLIEKINKKLQKYQAFLIKNIEELEKNKNNNDSISTAGIKKEQLETINNSQYDENATFNKNSKILKKDINNMNMASFDKNENRNSINEINNKNYNDVNYYQNQNEQNNNLVNDENDFQVGKSIQIDYDPGNLLDMKKFSDALNHRIKIDDNKLLYIFREIRLRIFRRNNLNLRHLTLYEIFYYDLFGLTSKTSCLFRELISNQILNLEIMKLINCLASYNKGKNYLLMRNNIIDDIVQCMINEKSDTNLRQNCLGTIQKFTLRTEPQNRLIELNVIHYIVDIFTMEAETLSDYTIEYGLALIMNLSLRKAGREKFEAVYDKTLQILLKFMDKDSIQILTCINGTLYSLLKKEIFKKEAKRIGLDKKLINFNIDNPQLQKQIKYILDELNNPPEEEADYEEKYEEDVNTKDEEENNVDEYADADSIDGNLLEDHYKVLGEFIIRDNNKNSIEEQKIEKFMNNNPTMAKLKNRSILSNSIDSSYRADDLNRPLHRPITPNSELSMTGTNQKFKVSESKNVILPPIDYSNAPNYPQDSALAFMKKDKLKRTPPRKYKK